MINGLEVSLFSSCPHVRNETEIPEYTHTTEIPEKGDLAMLKHPFISRFFVNTDVKRERLIYNLPESWWSRPYEYEWCMNFISPHDTVLDAACGITQPLKFHLAEVCEEVHACDKDERILSREAILQEIMLDIGVEAADEVMRIGAERLHMAHADLKTLPYDNECFDTIFCISVLEHITPHDTVCVLREFHRILNGEGLLVLTFNYPTVDLSLMNELLLQAGFVYWGETDFELPADALYTDLDGGLNCFRAILKKVI